MGSKTQRLSNKPKDIEPLRAGLASFLQSGGSGGGNAGATFGGQSAPAMPGFAQGSGTAYPEGSLAGKFAGQMGAMPGVQQQEIDQTAAFRQPTPQTNFGGQPTGGSGFEQMFSQLPPEMQRTLVAQGPNVGFNQDFLQQITGPDFQSLVDTRLTDMNRDQFRDAKAERIGNIRTQSVDQLGGANSAFFQNMQNQLAPAFEQARAQALAAAREGMGNLTGSGAANTLGAAVNRSLGDEQARLADYATQGLGMEVNRQSQLAGINTQRNMADQDAMLRASLANQGADFNFVNQLLQGGGQRLQAGQLGLQRDIANQNNLLQGGQEDLRAQMANQGTFANAAGQQAQLDAARQQAMYQMGGQNSMANANNYLQALMGMSTTGVGPDQYVQKPGVGALLGPVAGIAGSFLGGPAGGVIASKMFG